MKKAINATLILLSLFCAASAAAQDRPKVEQVPQPTAEQQLDFAEAVRQTQEAKKDVEAAEARLEAARARAQATLFRVMATLKLSPDEYRAVMTNEGRLTFEKIPAQKQ